MNREQFIDCIKQEQGPLRRFLLVLCEGNGADADDIAQEALLKAYLSFEKYEGRALFRTWLFRIAYNCFYDHNSHKKTDAEPIEATHEKILDNSVSADSAFANEPLLNAIAGLPPQERSVILLFYMEDYQVKDIEKITGMPSGTIRSHLSRARSHLKAVLDKNEA